MKKKILIGSMLVLTLLLLMPSIPAVQQKSIEEGFKQDLEEKLVNVDKGGDIGVLTPGWDFIMMIIDALIFIFNMIKEGILLSTIIEFISNIILIIIFTPIQLIGFLLLLSLLIIEEILENIFPSERLSIKAI